MDLISDSYRQQQSELHDDGYYGTTAEHYAPLIAEMVNRLEVRHLLDYGCGSRLSLAEGLKGKVKHKLTYQAYDPCVEEYAKPPIPAQMVACIDVLEHIEEDRIDAVLDHLYELTEGVGFFSITTGPAWKTLQDGRNAHILQRPPEWWLPRIMARFDLQTYQVTGDAQFYVIVAALARPADLQDGKNLSDNRSN